MLYSLRVPHLLAKRELKAKEIHGTGKVEEFASESKSVETFYKSEVEIKAEALYQSLVKERSSTTGPFKVNDRTFQG